jgi:hypothetical protein
VPDVYYSSCWARIQLRFEDYTRMPLAATLAVPEPPAGDPVSNAGFFELDTVVIPYSCSVALNSYRTADECTVTFPYAQIPVDPRIIRQATVQVFAGQIDSASFAATQGVTPGGPITVVAETELDTGRSNEIFRGFIDTWEISLDGEDRIEITARDITGILLDAEMPVQGLAGIPKSMPLDEVIRRVVVGEGAARGALPDEIQQRAAKVDARRAAKTLAKKANAVQRKIVRAQAQVPPDPDLVSYLELELDLLTTDLVAAQALAEAGDSVPVIAARYGLPGMRGLRVVNETNTIPLPGLEQLKGADWFDSAGTAKKAKRGAAKKRISYWDFITDMCVGCGFICYFRTPTGEGLPPGAPLPPAELVIAEPRTYYVEAGLEVRTFVYGFNVDEMTISRDYTGRNVPDGVIVTAIEDRSGDHISVRYPGGPQAVTRAGGSALPGTPGVGDRAEYQTILLRDRIPGATAGETLTRIARSLYEQFGRGEFKVSLKTTNLGTFPSNWGSGRDDMFQLRAGDPIKVFKAESVIDDTQPQATTVGAFERLGPADKLVYLRDVTGLSELAAGIAVGAETSPWIQSEFRCQEVNIEWDHDSGFSFTVEAINYLDARSGVADAIAAQNATLQLVRSFNPDGF